MSNADAATVLHDPSLMPPPDDDDPVRAGPDLADRSRGSLLCDRPHPAPVVMSAQLIDELPDKSGAKTAVRPHVESIDRRRADETLAGQNAVLLAKTQATAAWVQSETLWRQVRDMERQMVDEREQAEQTFEELAAVQRELESERHERTAAQAANDELRQYLDQQEGHVGFLRDRIASIESERDLQQSCLGWMGRRRFKRLLQQRWTANPRSALMADDPEGSATVGNPLSVPEQHGSEQFQSG